MKPPKKVLIVGGVAGGASCAARLRRLDEEAEITVYDRGPFVSFANCGLPYHVGGVIPQEASLLLASPQLFHERFRIQVKVLHEVISIQREARCITVKNLETGEVFEDHYDSLVLSPGAAPVKPALPGLDLPGVFTVRTIPDTREIRQWLGQTQARHAVVAGGGFIGLEMAEKLRHLGLEVDLMQNAPQVMLPMDAEMVAPLHARLQQRGVRLHLNTALETIAQKDGRLCVNGSLHTDIVILGLGVRPETRLAREAGLALGQRGGILVDARLRTSDPAIHAIGDAVEVVDVITGQPMLLALAGPANRQSRVAADVIAGRDSTFRGVQGTAVCGVFDLTVAQTGASEKALRRAGISHYEKVYLHPKNHVAYYPGAERCI